MLYSALRKAFYLSHIYLICFFRWKIRSGGEPDGTRREMKRERATHALSSGLTAGTVCSILHHERSEITSHAFLFLSAQHVPPPGERGVRCLQSASPGRPQPPVHPAGNRTAGTGGVQNQTHIQVMLSLSITGALSLSLPRSLCLSLSASLPPNSSSGRLRFTLTTTAAFIQASAGSKVI